MSEFSELQARVSLLELVIDSLPGGRDALFLHANSRESRGNFSQVIPVTERKNVPVTLLTHAYGFKNYREARECLEALALSKGLGFVGVEFFADWLQSLESLRHSRANGFSWSEAFTRAGLEIPSNVMEHAVKVARETTRLERVLRTVLQQTIAKCPNHLRPLYVPLLESLLED